LPRDETISHQEPIKWLTGFLAKHKVNKTVMKSFFVYLAVFGLVGLSLTACQSINNETVCEPASSPFPTPPTNSLEDVRIAYAPNITIGRVCTFSGKVTRAQVYKHQIVNDLVFCLRPNASLHKNDGWDIVMSDTMDNDCGQGLNGIVTPPFHGENPISIDGYQFRNQGNTAENDGSVNAPQKVREFNFLFNQNDYETVKSAYICLNWNGCKNGLTQHKSEIIIATMPKSAGIMTITNLELGNLVPDDRAWIESMEFEVKIYLPAEK
jgi:hypothetical protein